MKNIPPHFTRRNFLRTSAVAAAGISALPYISCSGSTLPTPMTRNFGKLDFEVTSLGLGGQASLQWTSPTEDPAEIILKAFKLGVNYFDTSNYYGPSQTNFGRAFRLLNLIPGQPGYNEKLRKSIFLTSKTGLRWGKGGYTVEGVYSGTNGAMPAHTLYDVNRTLSQIFGDGTGAYPEGAYLDMVLIHNFRLENEVDVVFKGIEDTNPDMEHIGALAALRDVRDGTNLTGLNPDHKKLIKHIGFSGHYSSPNMIKMIQRDTYDLFDGMLVAINANDKLNLNMQHNVISVAAAKNMGIIAMKVFADGAMYTKPANWSNTSEHVVRTVGSQQLPSQPLVQYALTTPGIHTAIIGIGHVDDDPAKCQLHQNYLSAQIEPDGLGEGDRKEIEQMALAAKEGKTNYFQVNEGGLTPPDKPEIKQEMMGEDRVVTLAWNTAIAGDEAIKGYEIWRDGEKTGELPHQPQTGPNPFHFEDKPGNRSVHIYKIITVDAAGNKAESEEITVRSV
ncbi:MAG: aldo/keto reductase [Bacteroidales bacterium]|nr:aldo/keto reductase [Bacteroidales bacterium]